MSKKIMIIVIFVFFLIPNGHSLTDEEKEAVEFFKTRLIGGVYSIEDYEKERGLSISDKSKITDKDLFYLTKLKNLILLYIHKNGITDKGIKYIKDLKNLKYLSLHDTQLTDSGMEYIGQLENLEKLNISNTKVTDDGLKYIRNLKKL